MTGRAASAPRSGRRRVLRRLLRDWPTLTGVVIIVVALAAAAAAPMLTPFDPARTDFLDRFAGPGLRHPLGTDNLGRDELSRLLHGARLSLGIAVVATAGITVLGLVLGLLAGLAGRIVDTVVMRVADILMALPTLVLALVVVGVLGQGLRNLVLTIIFVGWPQYARIVRGLTLSLRERLFVEASIAMGASRRRIALGHITPNLLGTVTVLSTLDMGRVLLAVSGLSFLGLGISPPTPEWGSMLAEGKDYLDRAPQLLAYPGLAIAVMVLAFNLAGDGLRDLLDSRTSTISQLGDAGPTGSWTRMGHQARAVAISSRTEITRSSSSRAVSPTPDPGPVPARSASTTPPS